MRYSDDDVRSMIRNEGEKYVFYKNTTGINRWAKMNNVSTSRVSEFMNYKRGPTNDILDALGLEWAIVDKKEQEHEQS